jgi:hypothetical protein
MYQLLEIVAPGHPLDGRRGDSISLAQVAQASGAQLGPVDEQMVSILETGARGYLALDGSLHQEKRTADIQALMHLGCSADEAAAILDNPDPGAAQPQAIVLPDQDGKQRCGCGDGDCAWCGGPVWRRFASAGSAMDSLTTDPLVLRQLQRLHRRGVNMQDRWAVQQAAQQERLFALLTWMQENAATWEIDNASYQVALGEMLMLPIEVTNLEIILDQLAQGAVIRRAEYQGSTTYTLLGDFIEEPLSATEAEAVLRWLAGGEPQDMIFGTVTYFSYPRQL